MRFELTTPTLARYWSILATLASDHVAFRAVSARAQVTAIEDPGVGVQPAAILEIGAAATSQRTSVTCRIIVQTV